MRRPTITLLTDFGSADGYVGAVKGVILSLLPDARIIDLAHDLPPGDVHAAAFVWASVVPFQPRGAVHLGVVDPGVGTDRLAVAVASPEALFVAPDNGLLTGLAPPDPDNAWRVASLSQLVPGDVAKSTTFHGRDVFAPAAAHLASGIPLDALGPELPLSALARLPEYYPRREEEAVRGRVMIVDRFGNLRTNIPRELVPSRAAISVLGPSRRQVAAIRGTVSTYGVGPPDAPFAYFGSAETLEIALQGASAARKLEVGAGATVVVR